MCLSVPAKLISINGDDPLLRTGKVSLGGILKDISLAYVPEAQVGNYVLVHVGFGIAVIDEAEAQFVFDYLQNMGESPESEAGISAGDAS
jgi:hydrogenase expression/formation protein HypC